MTEGEAGAREVLPRPSLLWLLVAAPPAVLTTLSALTVPSRQTTPTRPLLIGATAALLALVGVALCAGEAVRRRPVLTGAGVSLAAAVLTAGTAAVVPSPALALLLVATVPLTGLPTMLTVLATRASRLPRRAPSGPGGALGVVAVTLAAATALSLQHVLRARDVLSQAAVEDRAALMAALLVAVSIPGVLVWAPLLHWSWSPTRPAASTQPSDELYDGLTGLCTPQVVSLRGPQLVHDHPGAEHGFGVLVVDVDGLGRINRYLGRTTGDRVLASIARQVSDSCGQHDLVARIDGARILVLMRAGQAGQVRDRAQRIRARVRADAATLAGVDGARLTVSVAAVVGAGQLPRDRAEAEIWSRVDQAVAHLREAKRTGPDQVVLAPPGATG